MKILERQLKINEPALSHILEIVNKLHENGYECYLVGGSVRDLILGHDSYDFDFATNANPEEVMKLFKRVVPTGLKHGTVTVLIKESSYEITTYRADGKYLDGRRPENVEFSDTLEQDVIRRDFTINGLAYDISQNRVIDYVGGLDDLDNKIIRTIGDPVQRFSEDGLRPLRACRFASKLLFQIEKETFNAINKCIDTAGLVSAERVRDEIMKLVATEKPSVGIEYMRESGLLELYLPELTAGYGIMQNKFHIHDIYYHSLYSCEAIPDADPLIKFAALLHDIGKVITKSGENDAESTYYNHEVVGAKMARRLMKRLKFSNDDIARVSNLIINHMFHYTSDWTDGAVRRFMRKAGLENMNDLFLLRLADRRGNGQRDGLPVPILELQKRIQRVIEQDNALTVKNLDINGNVLMNEFGISPGPVIGQILNALLELVLDDPELNEREILLAKAKEIFETIKS